MAASSTGMRLSKNDKGYLYACLTATWLYAGLEGQTDADSVLGWCQYNIIHRYEGFGRAEVEEHVNRILLYCHKARYIAGYTSDSFHLTQKGFDKLWDIFYVCDGKENIADYVGFLFTGDKTRIMDNSYHKYMHYKTGLWLNRQKNETEAAAIKRTKKALGIK